MQEYVTRSIELAKGKINEIDHVLDSIEEVQETWQDALNDIQKKILEKALEFGITKEEMDPFTDEELKQMYENEEGLFCWACKQMHSCSKHFAEKYNPKINLKGKNVKRERTAEELKEDGWKQFY